MDVPHLERWWSNVKMDEQQTEILLSLPGETSLDAFSPYCGELPRNAAKKKGRRRPRWTELRLPKLPNFSNAIAASCILEHRHIRQWLLLSSPALESLPLPSSYAILEYHAPRHIANILFDRAAPASWLSSATVVAPALLARPSTRVALSKR